ncbi:MAG: aminotransferase class I/II-fold pyridoxal phosphate-dependent enzyme [Cyclobacteriaceae bacterium]
MKRKRVFISPPDLTGEESRFVEDIFSSNWVAPVGPHLAEFEAEIARFTGFKHALAVNSGTSAIHLALLCHGIQADDLVISSSLTFCGAVNPVLYLKARPILIDSNPDDWNIDIELLEKAIVQSQKKPKAILITHLFGMPADFDAIKGLSEKYEIPVIHDLAEALGCKTQNTLPGKVCDTAIASFNGNKLVTTSGGGALLTNNEAHYTKGLSLSTQAKAAGKSYNHIELGYNYRMSNVLAGIGLGQFTKIEEKVQRKREIFDYYKKCLGGIPGLKFQKEAEGLFSDRWLSAIYFDPKVFLNSPVESIINALEEENIESRHVWKPMHLQPLYSPYEMYGGKVAESLYENGICLPSGTSLRQEDQDQAIEILINTLKAFQ